VHLTWRCSVGKSFTPSQAGGDHRRRRRGRGSNLFPRLQVHVAVDVFFLLRHRLVAQPPAQHLVDLRHESAMGTPTLQRVLHCSAAQHAATHLLNGEAEVGRLVARGPHTAHDAFVINACSPSYQQQRKRDRMHAPASKLYPLTSSCDDSASVLRPSTALHQRQQWQARMRRTRQLTWRQLRQSHQRLPTFDLVAQRHERQSLAGAVADMRRMAARAEKSSKNTPK
jgi:hypothetical protein